MNAISGVSTPPAPAGSDAASNAFPPERVWPGLAHAARAIGVPLEGEAAARFAQYQELLLTHSVRFNLTAIREPHEIERRLFLDAVAMVPALDAAVAAIPLPAGQAHSLVDIGTGAGFPGLVLKIVRPALDVTLIDATAKKVSFLRTVIAALKLDTVGVVHGRAEDLGHDPAFRARFDVATARAVANLPVLLEYVVPLLKIGGTALLPKGLEIDEELRTGNRAAAHLGAAIVSDARLPVDGTRLIIASKCAPTPGAYPRRVGIPSRSPLGERS
ncbi:MAG: 16S rRNA (guanine(527)-N(7))-methyltransferase RsmG [Chloroflexia bacterium]|nr:16S rRNA (guanine(527)-N(7))-methyltransferase RsmG [Chloroflexia bacterium]